MIKASIHTQSRIINVKCENNRDQAISALQNAVNNLTEADGRCQFIITENGHEIYSWSYQPTIRPEKYIKRNKETKSHYEIGSAIYVIFSNLELNYENLYHDGLSFDTVKQAREYMHEKGYGLNDYDIVYEYIVTNNESDCIYGSGLGYSKNEAKINLNNSLSYYHLELKNNRIISVK